MKILVADDSKTTRTLLALSLKKLGHEVIEATNGQQALELFQKDRPDLIILDVIMEGIDGFECARMIRNINTDDWIPIIFLSGAVDDENIARGINAGGDDYLTKPYSEITLFAKIKAMQRIADMRTKLYEMTQKLSALSSTDALTGIYNRLQFDRAVKEKISYANRYSKKIALLFIDLDKFKIVNDTLGHYVGDLLLIEVAKRLQSCIRLDDFIARIGGDEFAIILSHIDDIKIIDVIAEKIIKTVGEPFNLAGNNINIRVSIGISCYPTEETTADNFVQNADIAMYHAKESGRNNYKYFTAALEEKHKKQVGIENALKHALKNQEFSLQYQPIFDLKKNKIVSVEGLLSWYNSTFGKIPAETFIQLAEEMELIDKIGEWVLRSICEHGKTWHNNGFKNIKLAVNLSPYQLLRKDLPQLIHNITQDIHLPPQCLELELTETSPLIYSELSEKVLNAIHGIGVKIILDDFGTGYSSLIHLRKLPISAIKIDKIFVHDITKANHNVKIIKSIIAMGNNLGCDVIAEGIENQQQLDFLIANECPFGQGFYLSPPLNHEQMTKLLEKFHMTA